MTRFTTSDRVIAVSRHCRSIRLILDSAVIVTAVLYRIGSTPSTASGTPMYVMMSTAEGDDPPPSEAGSVEYIIAENQCYLIRPDKIRTEYKGLCQSVWYFLYGV